MPNALGEQLLIDLYACKEESMTSAHGIQTAIADILINEALTIEELSCQAGEDEVVLSAIANHFHLTLHAYPELGYVAASIFRFDIEAPLTNIMKELRSYFGAEKIKSTSIQRGDFGSVRDMKPRRKTKITALGRVTRSRISIKNASAKMTKTGVKAVKAVAKKAKIKK